MKIIFESKGRKYEAEFNDLKELYDSIKAGMIAMSYHEETAKDFINELKLVEEDG